MSDTSVDRIDRYVQQKQEVLTAENYTPEDALVFAQLSYMKFEEVYGAGYNGKVVSVSDYAKDILDHQPALSANDESFLKAVYNSERYENCTVDRFAAENEQSQWAAFTIHMNDSSDSSVIAMRGTNGTELGWKEDLELLYDADGTEAQKLAAQYLQESPGDHIYLTGHSKGGNDVSSAFAMSDGNTRSKVVQIDNFDGPGVNEKFQNEYAEGYAQLGDKLSNYYPQDSFIGLLLADNPGKNYFVMSSDEGGFFMEHDPYNWKFEENGSFQYTEQSELSDFFNEVLDNTVSTLSQRERVLLIDMLTKLGAPALIGKDMDALSDRIVYGMIGNGASLYMELKTSGQYVFSKTIAAFVVFAVLERLDTPEAEAMKKALQDLFAVYTAAADFLDEIAKKMADAVRSFASDLKNAIDNLADAVTQFFQRKKSRRKGGSGSFGKADFMIEPKRIAKCENELAYCRELINDNQSKILFIMGKLALYADFVNACNLGGVVAELEQEEKSCRKLEYTLSSVRKQYENSEQDLLYS